jgi:hypothetical protein
MHQRARQESLLEDEENLEELQRGMPPFLVKTEAGGRKTINVWPDNTVTLRLERGDLPDDFDANCVGFGPEAAGAKAVVDALAPVLASSGTLLRQTAQSLFEQIDEDERLPMFRTLADSLPSSARESLEVNGL